MLSKKRRRRLSRQAELQYAAALAELPDEGLLKSFESKASDVGDYDSRFAGIWETHEELKVASGNASDALAKLGSGQVAVREARAAVTSSAASGDAAAREAAATALKSAQDAIPQLESEFTSVQKGASRLRQNIFSRLGKIAADAKYQMDKGDGRQEARICPVRCGQGDAGIAIRQGAVSGCRRYAGEGRCPKGSRRPGTC